MTFIQPNKNDKLLNTILVSLGIVTLCGVFILVALYNNVVNLNHNIAVAKAGIDDVSVQNTNLNNAIIAALGSDKVATLAGTNNLIEDKKPQYFIVDSKWLLASQY